MNENQKNQGNESTKNQPDPGQPVGPRHTYGDAPGTSRSTPDANRPSSPREPQRLDPKQPGRTDAPGKPLPDYGDAEPEDPRRSTTTGEGGTGERSSSGFGGGTSGRSEEHTSELQSPC